MATINSWTLCTSLSNSTTGACNRACTLSDKVYTSLLTLAQRHHESDLWRAMPSGHWRLPLGILGKKYARIEICSPLSHSTQSYGCKSILYVPGFHVLNSRLATSILSLPMWTHSTSPLDMLSCHVVKNNPPHSPTMSMRHLWNTGMSTAGLTGTCGQMRCLDGLN